MKHVETTRIEAPPEAVWAYLWHLRAPRSDATDVSIRFVATDECTRGEIEHARGDTWRDRDHQGWSTLLPHDRVAI